MVVCCKGKYAVMEHDYGFVETMKPPGTQAGGVLKEKRDRKMLALAVMLCKMVEL